MSDQWRPLEDMWEGLKDKAMPNLEGDQEKHAKRLFFAGAKAYSKAIDYIMEAPVDGMATRRAMLKAIEAELDDFRKSVEAGQA